MKLLVFAVQLIIISAMIYPIYYLWETDKVDNFCKQLQVGMTKDQLLQQADQHNVTLVGPDDDSLAGGKWQASVSAKSALSDYACVIKGAADSVASAKIVVEENP